MYKMMTPGPTMVPETVMEARSRVLAIRMWIRILWSSMPAYAVIFQNF